MEGSKVDLATMATMEAIRARRSIRRFKDDPVDGDTVRLLLEAATLAPSAHNAQPWDFVVVNEPETRLKLVDLIHQGHRRLHSEVRKDAPTTAEELEQRMAQVRERFSTFAGVPVYIVVCFNRKRKFVKDAFDASSYIWDILGVGAAIENLLITATALGLGTVWLGSTVLRAEAVKELLGIPEEVHLVAVIPLGYPDESPPSRPRDSLEKVVHYNRW